MNINNNEGCNELIRLSHQSKCQNILRQLPRILFLSLILMPILLVQQNSIRYANTQLMPSHSRNKIYRSSNHLSPTFYHPIRTLKPRDSSSNHDVETNSDKSNEDSIKQLTTSSRRNNNPLDENITSFSILPSSQEKQNELLRKLSSTMLLETLFRKTPMVNKSPFPQLPMLTLGDSRNFNSTASNYAADLPNRSSTSSQIENQDPRVPSYSSLDVSTTNRTTTTADRTNSLNVFNSSSLNYLVDKLLSVQPFKDGLDIQLKRPAPRYKSPYETNTSSSIEPNVDHNRYNSHDFRSTSTPMTLDMLIKDEYDSRVEPMLKSLLEQQTLSTPSKSTELNSSIGSKTLPINHKAEDSSIDTTLNYTEDPISNSTESIPSTTSSNRENSVAADDNDGDAAITFEDFEDDDDSSEDDTERDELQVDKKDSNEVRSNSDTNNQKEEDSSSKRLQNVPPYQFSNSLDSNDDRFKPIKSWNRQKEVPATTSSTTEPIINNSDSKSYKRESTSKENSRGSLVFSDGGDEAERANKRKVELNRGNKTSRINNFGSRNSIKSKERKDSTQQVNKSTQANKTEKSGDSLLLQQLFTTINPLSELNIKLKEQASVKDPTEISPQNPLIYKGYVGKDDYLLSSTARDWSRPINMTESSPTTLYKYSNIQPATAGLPTQPPSVPFTYSRNQPVTNAQSVPTMVIPTSDPPEFTTQYSTAKYDMNNRKLGAHISRTSPQKPPSNSHAHQSPPLLSTDRTHSSSNQDIRKYSYQIPERQPNKNRIQHLTNVGVNSTNIALNNSTSHVNELNESEHAFTRNKIRLLNGLKQTNKFDRNWSPSKIANIENSQSNNQQRQQTLNHDKSFVLTDSLMNSSSPMFVPMAEMKTTITSPINTTERVKSMISHQNVDDIDNGYSVSPIVTTEAPNMRASEIFPNRKESGFSELGFNQKNTSHKAKWNTPRKKSRIPSPATSPPDTWSAIDQPMGDTDIDTDQEVRNLDDGQPKRVRRPSLIENHISHENPSDKELADTAEDYHSESEEDHEDQRNSEQNQKANSRRTNMVGMKRNQTRKSSQNSIKHEPAGSEISLTGLDKNIQLTEGRPRNSTTNRFLTIKPKQTAKATETTLTGSTDGSSFPSITSTDRSTIPSSIGSTIIPHNNFFGEASSESPALENTIVNMDVGNINKIPSSTIDDVQRINDVQSNTQHTSSTKTPTSTVSTIPTKQDEDNSTTSPGQTKPPTKTSSDRLAFILIGGSCALSVVCLVLAAMSMRCQDMCDDYRSLRNAERAALKLQKHRLRYTKNHQINRFNHDRSLTGASHTVIEDLNAQNHPLDESDLDQFRNSKFLNNRSIQFNDPGHKNNNADLNIWNSSNCQLPLSACINKELQSCKCSSCLNQRWLYPDELLTNSKHLSWLHPYYYMQHHPRLRPLFGAASSVGTFFPRRHEDQSVHGGGSADAQILIDNQPSHSCPVIDQRGITSSKSILHKGKKSHPKHVNDVNAFREATSVECNNPEHKHSYHVCHNHHHRMISDTSASEESELTLDESLLCDGGKCANHQNLGPNGRHKLGHLKTNSHNHQPLWKSGSIRKSNQAHSHHHHHHHDQQQLFSSDGSSVAQCTCSRDKQPLILNSGRHNAHRTSHKHASKHDSKQQARRDKSLLVWSTNRDRLI